MSEGGLVGVMQSSGSVGARRCASVGVAWERVRLPALSLSRPGGWWAKNRVGWAVGCGLWAVGVAGCGELCAMERAGEVLRIQLDR
ncbi:hypothetical protein CALCODRAFT_328581 [Calocera cornea HHB12733]|uniref:Uncharacterized protein n=1 Tax=Calocera cornea HHB12733 TaxID=1353952 RepID=A0A165JHV6_9BASI|nr:hypothetical protein CALCODRAFT_328581 [Calocera cornea HHB12733]